MRKGLRQEKEHAPLTAATVRAVARALEGILFEIQGGAAFQITRLTRVKRLYADQATSEALASFIADRALAKLVDRTCPDTVPAERWKQLIALAREGVAGLERYMADRSADTERSYACSGRSSTTPSMIIGMSPMVPGSRATRSNRQI
jgi:hypothetical protein